LTLFWRPSGCVLWYDFAEKSGDTVYDLSGNGNHGTRYGATWKNGPLIGALEFDGVDDYVDCGSPTQLVLKGDLTIFAVVKPKSLSGSHVIIRYGYGLSPFNFQQVNAFFRLYYTIGGTWGGVEAPDVFTEEKWYYLAATRKYDGTTATLKLYVNGNNVKTATRDGIPDDPNANLMIGQNTNSSEWFHGTIAHIRVFNRALSEDEIKCMYRYLSSTAKQAIPSRFVPRGLKL